MRIYTYSEARQSLATVLEEAQKQGAVCIRRRDGQTFVVRPESASGSPLDIEGMELGITSAEIVKFVRESQRGLPDN